MTAPRLEACYLGPGSDRMWTRFAHVLAQSAEVHCPDWQIRVEAIAPPELRLTIGAPAHRANTLKLAHWRSRVQQSADGDRILLMDVDTLIIRPLDDIWDAPFDLAYTTKAAIPPFNAGVLFLRVSAGVRAFFSAWLEENLRLLKNPLQPWRRQYGGVNQASLASVLSSAHGLNVRQLPCAEWNCEDSAWASFDLRTRIVHYKSELRQALCQTGMDGVPAAYARLVAIWREVEAATTRCARTV